MMPSSEMPSGTQTQREDDKTETMFERTTERVTETHTVMDLNTQIQDEENEYGLNNLKKVGRRDP